MDTLDQRLQILNQSGLLSHEHVETARALRELFLKRYGILLTEENAAAFFTHFCMALHRQEAGECVQALDEVILDELADEFDYDAASFMADEIQRFVVVLPEAERGYILTHLLALLANIRKAYDDLILGGGAPQG